METRRRQRGRSRGISAFAILATATAFACGADEATTPAPAGPAPETTTPAEAPPAPAPAAEAASPAALDPSALVARGKQVYGSNCIACHNMNPAQPGALGPELAGSPIEVLEAKVLRNEYPAGYTPKRETKAMIPLPHLEKDLPAVAAYLASLE